MTYPVFWPTKEYRKQTRRAYNLEWVVNVLAESLAAGRALSNDATNGYNAVPGSHRHRLERHHLLT
jgi:hypothetical protein